MTTEDAYMITITVKFVGELRLDRPESEIIVSLPEGARVADLLNTINISPPGGYMISRSSEFVSESTPLHDRDRVSIALLPSSKVGS